MTDAQVQAAAALLGIPFLAYVLSLSEETVAQRLEGPTELSAESEEALADVLAHALELERDHPFGISPADPDGPPAVRMRRFGWTDLDRGQTHANLFRIATGGGLPPVPERLDAAETAIAAAAIDYFPITLLAVEDGHEFPPPRPTIARERVRALDAALANDPITELFAAETVFYTSSGMGYGPLDARRFAECALATAQQRMRMLRDATADSFIAEAVGNLRIMRELVTTGTCSLPAVVGYWNVEFPQELLLAGPRGGCLRAARDVDPHVPMSARATMVLETVCEVGLSKGAMPPSGGGSFWAGWERLSIDQELISLAGLLSGPGADGELALPVIAWTKIFDPFQPYVGMFSSARHGGHPTVHFPAERLPELENWIGRLDRGYHPSVRVAVRRTLSAVTERGPWDDALIDYAIALENLFGGPGPKLEVRISNALAAILGTTPQAQAEIAEHSRRVYQARSTLVHGDELPETHEHPQQHAQSLVLDALRSLFTSHRHLIADRKARRELGTSRSGRV